MKKAIFLIVAVAYLGSIIAKAQEKNEPCITHKMYLEAIKNNPEYITKQAELEAETDAYIAQQNSTTKSIAMAKIIPVVFHVIHQYGVENITRAQCLDQIRVLNEDFRRLNLDTGNTPAVFKPLAADCNIEFKIAQLDPNGNCTDGVNRIYSGMTVGARDNVKSLIYWDRSKYLNIWVVKNITGGSGTGYVIGFAQFPGGTASTDGVVVKYDFVGNIGAAAEKKGRTATHEVGHWLNLRHIWGDDGTACTGSDNVSDTPNQGAENFSTCPTFPHISCNNGPNGDMYSNYMDYTSATCQNMFSQGQSTRMNASLSSSTSGRNNLWSAANLVATGVNLTPSLCKPIADFTPHIATYICAGQSVSMADKSWGGAASSRIWYFEGGTPATSIAINPTVTYALPGTYNISLKVLNATGTDSVTKAGVVIVMPTDASYQTTFIEGFENNDIPNNDWTVVNFEPTSSKFERSSSAAASGIYSCKLDISNNNLQNDIDELISPSFNLTTYQTPKLIFKQAYAQTSDADSSSNQLQVYYSSSCGKTWSLLKSYTGFTLATAPVTDLDFTPNASQWIERTIALTNFNIINNIRFKFKFTGSSSGNNLYLDDINLSATNTSLPNYNESLQGFLIVPNPANSSAYIDISGVQSDNIKIEIFDAIGKGICAKNNVKLSEGKNQIVLFDAKEKLANGIYFVKVTGNNTNATKKLVVRD